MIATRLIDEARRHGALLAIVDGKLKAAPPGVLPPDLKSKLREHAPEIRALLMQPEPAADRAAWRRDVTTPPNSRQPLIPPEVRARIEAIEGEARRLGWPPELLWNSNFWDCPRGLAAVLDPEDEIVEVGTDCIAILKLRRDLLRFRRHAA